MSKPFILDPVKEAKAVAALFADIEASGYDLADQQLKFDTIEGQSNLFEVLDAVLDRMANDEAMIEGIHAVEKRLGARRARYEHRIKSARALVEQAMTIAELDSIERPIATLSMAKRAPSVVITEESEIPSDFWKPGTPTLDKKALTAAVRARAEALAIEDPELRAAALAAAPEIPGATLNNAAPTLTVRTA